MTNILIVDIETTPIGGWTWTMYDANVLKVREPSWILMTGYKWLGSDKPPQIISQPTVSPRAYKRNLKDDRLVVKKTWELLDKADIVVGQNSDAFDLKKLNARFLRHDLPQPSPFRTVDTLKVAKKHFKHESNSLKYLAEAAGVTMKIDAGGLATWFGCMEGDPASWAHMAEYCAYDVQSTLELYEYLRDNDWIRNHANVNMMNDDPQGCPHCGVHADTHQKRGFYYTQTRKQQRVQLPCGHYARIGGTKKEPRYIAG